MLKHAVSKGHSQGKPPVGFGTSFLSYERGGEHCVSRRQLRFGNILTSLWKATQAETLSTGSRTTTQHKPRSCCNLFIHTETGIFSPLRLTTSTCRNTFPVPGCTATAVDSAASMAQCFSSGETFPGASTVQRSQAPLTFQKPTKV